MFETYRGKRVFITGHTGFKGAWLCEMLLLAGAEVYGYALKPPTRPSLFVQLKLAKRIRRHTTGDVRDLKSLTAALRAAKPDYVFHLAAQPIVRESYRVPRETFDVNVMGTVNVLDAIRRIGFRKPVSVVCVTTDKCYENDNSGRAFREGDPLGGSDPYSASKGACEIAIAAYRRSFFEKGMVVVASARAGNVIGGGDWASDRIVPDAMRAFLGGETLTIRNGKSTRPWQHVLEPLCGYLMLGAAACGGAFNFGPDERTVKTVGQLVRRLMKTFPDGLVEERAEPNALREAKLLCLDSAKARKILKWSPRWGFDETVFQTATWYARVDEGENPQKVTDEQIARFLALGVKA